LSDLLEADAADDPIRIGLEAERPDPFVAALDCRQRDIPEKLAGAIRWIRPGHDARQVADDLPMREQPLHLFGVGELQRLQEQAGCLEGRRHQISEHATASDRGHTRVRPGSDPSLAPCRNYRRLSVSAARW